MFVAEAPGRNGADRTGVPLHGDPSGANFEGFLKAVGWERGDVFVTNAVLCNPRDEKDNNAPPSDEELQNCSFHLESTILAIDPRVIVTLGAKPLAAMGLIERHNLSLSSSVGRAHSWYGRVLFPLYHPSPRALMARSLSTQREDFVRLAAFVNQTGGVKDA